MYYTRKSFPYIIYKLTNTEGYGLIVDVGRSRFKYGECFPLKNLDNLEYWSLEQKFNPKTIEKFLKSTFPITDNNKKFIQEFLIFLLTFE